MAICGPKNDGGGGMSSGTGGIEDLLKALREEYLESIPAKVTLIREQVAAGKTSDLRDSYHKLKGTGRTYGLPEISELAEICEILCRDGHPQAHQAALDGAALLHDIHAARQKGESLKLDTDARFEGLRNLLKG